MNTNKRRDEMGQSGFSIPGKFGVCWATFSLFFLAAFVGVAECLTIDVHYRMTSCVIVKAVKDEPINGNFEVLGPVPKHWTEYKVVLRAAPGGKPLYVHKGVENHFKVRAPETGDYELCFINRDDDELRLLEEQEISRLEVGLQLEGKERKEKMDKKIRGGALNDNGDKGEGDPSADVFLGLFENVYGDDPDSVNYDDSWSSQYDTATFGFNIWLKLAPGLAQLTEQNEESKREDMMLDEATLLMRSLAEFSGDGSYLRRWEALQRDVMAKTTTSLVGATLIEAVVLILVSWAQLSYIRRFFETKRIL